MSVKPSARPRYRLFDTLPSWPSHVPARSADLPPDWSAVCRDQPFVAGVPAPRASGEPARLPALGRGATASRPLLKGFA
jgi:hypothetical protein